METEKNTNIKVNGCCNGIATILTVIFVIAKILGLVSWSWFVCFLPLIISVGLIVIITLTLFIIGIIAVIINR